MTPEKQQIAIAEFCGWVRGRPICDGEWVWKNPEGSMRGQICIPRYLQDLNFIHEAVTRLEGQDRFEFGYQLDEIIGRKFPQLVDDDNDRCFLRLNAPASMRAEALLRTIKKWEDK